MRNVSSISCIENQTHILCSKPLFRKWCCLRDNVEKYGTARQATDNNIIWHIRFAWWMCNATNTHSEYVINTAFLLQKWLHESVSMLRPQCYVICTLPVLYHLDFVIKAPYHRRMVGLTVEVGVPQFENPRSTLFKNLEFVNDVNTISWPNAVSSMNCGNNCKSVSKRQSVLIKVSCWLWECFETSVGLNKGFLLIIRVFRNVRRS